MTIMAAHVTLPTSPTMMTESTGDNGFTRTVTLVPTGYLSTSCCAALSEPHSGIPYFTLSFS